MDINGKVALVTGAASGIGRASARALARAGAAVVVVDVDESGGAETVALIESDGGRARLVRADVTDPASMAQAFAAAEEAFGGVDIVHNNAGIVSGDPPWPGTPADRVAAVISVNLGGVAVGTRIAVDHLRKRGGGAVVNTASIAAQVPMADDPTYAASKAGIVMFTQSCAALRERENIRVNAVLPGMVDTPIIAKTGDGTRPAEWLRPALEAAPMLQPEDVAAAVLELVRDEGSAGQAVLVLEPASASSK